MAGATGLEPAASCVTGRSSNQLNYAPAFEPTNFLPLPCDSFSFPPLPSGHDALRVSGVLRYNPRVLEGAWEHSRACARFPRLKEWAYAGIFFNMTGAAASHAVCRDATWHEAVTLTFATLTVASWALPRRFQRARSWPHWVMPNLRSQRPHPNP